MTDEDQIAIFFIVFVPFVAFGLLIAAMEGLDSLIGWAIDAWKKQRARSVWAADSVWDARSWDRGWHHDAIALHTGRRANATPRVGQVWKSSDPRRLSAFRIVWVDRVNRYPYGGYVYVEMITTGAARTIPVERFQVLGSKGYTRVS